MIIVRGGGDIATGTIYTLHQCGYHVLILETPHPTAIRRKVSFCEAVYDSTAVTEGVTCRRIDSIEECRHVWDSHEVPLLIDPQAQIIEKAHPQVLIDAILAKKNLGTNRGMADLTIALGPGFCAGTDVDYVVETMRGHQLGRIIEHGYALPNTGIPGMIAGHGADRVIHAPASGNICVHADIGDTVEEGQILASIGDVKVTAAFSGVLRGMIRDGFAVTEGLKIADIDPRIEQKENCGTISDKARCIAGSVLEILVRNQRLPERASASLSERLS